MKLSKYHLTKILKNINTDGSPFTSEQSIDELLDVIFEALELKPGLFLRELVMREFFSIYMERYPVYAAMQQGMKSNMVSRLYNNDLESLVLIPDSVLPGKRGLFVAYCTEDRRSALSLLEAIPFQLDVLVRQFVVDKRSGDMVYVALTPLESLLSC